MAAVYVRISTLLKHNESIKLLQHDKHPSGARYWWDPDSEKYYDFIIVFYDPLMSPPLSPEAEGKTTRKKSPKGHAGFYAVVSDGRCIEMSAPSKRKKFIGATEVDSEIDNSTYVIHEFNTTSRDFNDIIKLKEMADARIKAIIILFRFQPPSHRNTFFLD